MRARLFTAVLVVLAFWAPQASQSDPLKLRPRVPADKRAHAPLPEPTEVERLVVKFHEGTAVRLRGGVLVPRDRSERDRRDLAARGLLPSVVESDAAEVRRLAALAPGAQAIRRHVTLDEETVARRRAEGEARSGRQLADLDLYFSVPVGAGVTAGQVAEILRALNALPSVEIAYAQPPARPASVERPEPLPASATPPVTTPDFQSQQGYLNAAPGGVDALYAWTQPGGTGQGIKIVDIEGGWRTTHEDLPTLFHAQGSQINDPIWINHGTAVLGEMVGKNNGFGVTGIVYQAQAGYESIGSQSLASALLGAGEAAGAGGVVLIELHYGGPANSSPCTCNTSQCDLIPAEYYQDHYDAIADLTANGTVVVEAAGNGSTDLDDPVYGGVFNRNVRDSGAILVAASNPFDRNPTCWTNWGSRIDMHGWGGSVVTLGYGGLFNGGTEDRWYTGSFSGTSSASPIVTGAAVSLRAHALATLGDTLDPLFVRDLLKENGTPQVPGPKNIGPLPDLRAAFDALDGSEPPVCYTLTTSHTGSGGDPAVSIPNSAGCPLGEYRTGAVLDLTASPDSGWRVVGWTGTDDDASPSTFNTLTMPAADAAVSVAYEVVEDIALDNGVPVNDAFMADQRQAGWRYYYFDVEERSSNLVVDLFDLSLDVDLYVRFDGKPTLALYDCRPYVGGLNAERCSFSQPAAGRWWIGVNNWDTGELTYWLSASWNPPPVPLDFYTLPPCRVVNTQSGSPLGSGATRNFFIAGNCGVPATAKAVALNITVIAPTANGNVVLWPGDQIKPGTSSINFAGGQIRANNAVLSLATDGLGDVAAQSFLADGGTVHLILDVTGWFE